MRLKALKNKNIEPQRNFTGSFFKNVYDATSLPI